MTLTSKPRQAREGTVRLSIDIDPDLHRRLRIRVAEMGTTITRLATDAVERALDETERTGDPR